MIVATGERSELPQCGSDRTGFAGTGRSYAGSRSFPRSRGYHAGVCRTAVVQEPPPEAERIWANLTTCKYQLLDTVKPGAMTRKIYDDYLKTLSELDLPAISFIGHGIGLHLHEDPYLGPTEDVPLEAGMVLGVEPLVYRTGFGFGMQNKDMMAVTADGMRSNATRYLQYSVASSVALPGQSHHSDCLKWREKTGWGTISRLGMARRNSSRLRGIW